MYSRQVDDKIYTFGVSGMLYKSNVLMYDHQTESLWSQIKRRAVTGVMTDAKLKVIPSTLTTWKKWRTKHPTTDVLTPATGHVRDYSKDPYEDYYESRSGLFGFLKGGPGAEDKELVVGIEISGEARAYKLAQLRREKIIVDRLGDLKITLSYTPETDLLTVRDNSGQQIESMILYWFVWNSIYPDSDIH